MFKGIQAQTAGIWGMSGAALFFVGLVIEYHYGLFPPGSGTLYTVNQIMFVAAIAAILVMLLGLRAAEAGGSGLLSRVFLTLFPIGWAILLMGSTIDLVTGRSDSPLIPIGALVTALFGFLAGLSVAIAGKWQGWTRFAPLLQGTYYIALVGYIFVSGVDGPTFLTESMWMAFYFLVGLALYANGKTAVQLQHA